jgi:hypothetical protein
VIPDFLICSITGRVLAANWSAFSRFAWEPLRCASASFGPPSFTPRAFAAASACFVRSLEQMTWAPGKPTADHQSSSNWAWAGNFKRNQADGTRTEPFSKAMFLK